MTDDRHPLGKITKTRGYNGTVVLVSDRPLDECSERLEEVFVVIDGLQVPFPVKRFDLITDTSAHIQLEFIDNCDQALQLIGCEVYAAIAICEPEPEEEHEQWTGFTVHDTEYGRIGIVQKIEDYNGNIVMQVIDGDKETLISLYPGLITGIDPHAEILHVALPDGYF